MKYVTYKRCESSVCIGGGQYVKPHQSLFIPSSRVLEWKMSVTGFPFRSPRYQEQRSCPNISGSSCGESVPGESASREYICSRCPRALVRLVGDLGLRPLRFLQWFLWCSLPMRSAVLRCRMSPGGLWWNNTISK